MGSALAPKDGRPPRLIRFGSLPAMSGLMAILDFANNILLIDREFFDELGELDRDRVIKTHAPFLTIKRRPGILPTFVAGEHPPAVPAL